MSFNMGFFFLEKVGFLQERGELFNTIAELVGGHEQTLDLWSSLDSPRAAVWMLPVS